MKVSRVSVLDPVQPFRVGLFVTCLVDLMRPSVAFAAAKLLEQAGCRVEVPKQTCCGQPALNSGDRQTARTLAERMIETFQGVDYVVAPSGSCAATVRAGYPELFADDPIWRRKAEVFAARTHELTSFLVDILGLTGVDAALEATTTYHDSCTGLRTLGIREQPRKLLASVKGLSLAELSDPDACCGFGGTFAVKYGDISNAIVTRKTADVTSTGATLVLGGDLGCLMNIAGKLSRDGSPIECRHIAEVLAGMTDDPPLGCSDEGESKGGKP